MDKLSAATIYESQGCETCRGLGYKGRMGIFEILELQEKIEPLILGRQATSKIKQEALSCGIRTLRDDGWDKVLQGLTTVEEVLRASEEDE